MIPKVSVIIPVYNVEKYVEQSVRSILNQSLKEIEIIIVNDGSKDSSLEIVKKIAIKDERIHIISTPNNGLSIARNIGFYNASGEYVYFFDSDDLLEAKTLEECYDKASKYNLDLLFFDADVFYETNIKTKFNYIRSDKYEDIVYNGIDILNKQLYTDGYKSSVCLLFLKRNYLINININFYPRILHEDELFTFLAYLKANKVGFINKVYFHRRVRDNSIMNSKFDVKKIIGYTTVCRELLSFSFKYDTNSFEKKLIVKRVNTIIAIILNEILDEDLRSLYMKIVRKEFMHNLNWKNKLKLLMPNLYFKLFVVNH